jgi:hypothetical protein
MRNGFLAAVGVTLLGGAAAFAQTPSATSPAKSPTVALPLAPAPEAGCCGSPALALAAPGCDGEGGWRATFSADYLLWWVRSGPTPGPLLTVGSANDAIPGALGQPGTVPIFGGENFAYHTFSGLRLGGSVILSSGLGLDGSGFVLERRSVGFRAASDASGNPLIARPVFNDHAGLQESYSTSFPGNLAGQSAIVSHTQLEGFDVNLAAELSRCESRRLVVLAGFRYLSLREDLLFQDALTPLTADFLTFDGASVNPPSTVADFDSFKTRNHFYGGQIGGRWEECFGKLSVGLTGKVALGGTEQRVVIEGGSVLNTPGTTSVVVPGGILAQVSNIGTHSRDVFSVVSEVGLNVGWQVTPNVSVNVGYTFIYWTDVLRPGAQIDTRVSPFVVPTDQNFGGGTPSGHPAFAFKNSDFWAQGVNFGVTLRF